MRRFIMISLLVMPLLTTSTAQGHFIWLAATDVGTDNAAAKIYFAEDAEPGEARLIDKIAATKLSLRTVDGAPQPLTAQPVVNGETAALEAALPRDRSLSLAATCDYGVLAKGDKPFLLQYYARHLRLADDAAWKSLALDTDVALQVVPHKVDGELEFEVVWQNKPVANAELYIVGLGRNPLEVSTNEQGRVRIKQPAASCDVRAKWIEPNSGERNGKPFTETRHYSTLTMVLNDQAAATKVASKPKAAHDALSATDLLARARAARAVWKDFPGFSANVTVRIDGKSETGTFKITTDGATDIAIETDTTRRWVARLAQQMVEHRLPGSDRKENAAYADEESQHPLGRKIRLNDRKDFDSVYRIRDDVVSEVNRSMGTSRFTISVIEVARNAENKYLPRVYTVTIWNEHGDIVSTHTAHNEWNRVGAFDLPSRVTEVHGGKHGNETRQIEFSNLKLLTE